MNQKLNLMMRAKEFSKYYDAIVRGWFKEPYGKIDLPLELDSTGDLAECTTLYSTSHTLEVEKNSTILARVDLINNKQL